MLHNFNPAQDVFWSFGLAEGSDGVLYGMGAQGGTNGTGGVFKIGKTGSGFEVLRSFNYASDGGYGGAMEGSDGGLIEGSDGALYGTTAGGGPNEGGTVFRMTKDNSEFTVLKSFPAYWMDGTTDGANPSAKIFEGSDGVLYGTTLYGGYGAGAIFRINKNGTEFGIVWRVDPAADGWFLTAGVTEGSDGALYGTAHEGGPLGGGTVFRVDKNGTQLHVLKAFTRTGEGGDGEPLAYPDGGQPTGGLTEGSDGALYGSSYRGGGGGFSGGPGILFRLQKDGTGFTILNDFSGYRREGSLPRAEVIEGSDGALYGTTSTGGTLDAGTVYRVNKDGSGFAVLKSFDPATDGANPLAGLKEGSGGVLYGTTTTGGPFGSGTVFRINKDGSGLAVLKSFDYGTEGAGYYPAATLTEGSDGFLYGTAHTWEWRGDGSQIPEGVIFRINKDGSGFAALATVAWLSGGPPLAEVIEGSDGVLYGTASSGGSLGYNSYGTVFRLNRDGSDFAVLKSFDYDRPTDGASPNAGLTEGNDGALYGTTYSGGVLGGGTVFRLNKDGGGFVVLKHLGDSADGSSPNARLIEGSDGALYGTTVTGGDLGGGTVFRLNKDGNGFEVLLALGSSPGSPAWPGTLTFGSDGRLYGTSTHGGDLDLGAVFALQIGAPPVTPTIQSLSPAQAVAGAGDVAVTIGGLGFQAGSQVQVGGVVVSSTFVSATELNAIIPGTLLPAPVDFATVQITVHGPGGEVSPPAVFTVIGSGVSGSVGQVDSGVAGAGETVAVETLPSAPDSAGVTASLENSTGTTPATVTAATYTENPTPAAAFEAGGGFVDLQVSGADPGDRLSTAFYYPQTVTGAAETALTLRYFNGTNWIDVVSSSGSTPAKNTQDNLDGTVSGGRFQVVFDNTSTPQITELNGTVFAVAVPDVIAPTVSCPNVTVPCNVNLSVPVNYPAPMVSDNVDPAPRVTYSIASGSGFNVGTTTVTCTVTDAAGNVGHTTFTVTRAPLGFTGFLAPIGGADATGGSFASPLRTFKAGSTIPVKFSASCGGSAVTTGLHQLQATKYSDATTSGTPIDATPQDAATTGNQFRLAGSDWQFNLDTKSTGLTKGIWQLVATLSDGSQHVVWVQIK